MNNDINNLDDDLDQDILDLINKYRQEQEDKDYYTFCSEDLLDYSLNGVTALDR